MACKNEVVNTIVKVLDSKLAKDIEVLDVSELTTMAEYFILATGGSDRQVQALCDHVEEALDKQGIFAVNKEGYRTGEWVLLGYDDAIVHIFKGEIREFYGLERIWKDAVMVNVDDIMTKDNESK